MRSIRKKKPLPPKEEDTIPLEQKKEGEEELHISEVRVEEKSSPGARIVIPVIIGFVVGAATATSILLYYNSRSSKVSPTPQPTPTVMTTPSLEEKAATPSSSLTEDDLSLYDIKILNGSGKAGEAGRLEKILKGYGFAVLEIGNADSSNYKKTLIKAKEKVSQNYLDKLQEKLEELFELDEIENLSDKEEVEVVIIVGSLPKQATSSGALSPTENP